MEEKRRHCQPHPRCFLSVKVYFILKPAHILDVNVVKAFESALALLGGI